MKIIEVKTLTESQVLDVQDLIKELVPGLTVESGKLAALVAAPGTHFFAAVDDDGHVVQRSVCLKLLLGGRLVWRMWL